MNAKPIPTGPPAAGGPFPDLTGHCLAITEHAPLPMATVEGAAHVVRYGNPAFCRLMNRPLAELVGQPFAQLLPEKDQCVTLLERVFRTREPASFTEQDPTKPHPVFWSYTIWPVQQDEGLVGIMIQVTETAVAHGSTVAMNEALMLGSLRQHEMTEAAENLNAQLRLEIAERKQVEEVLRRRTDQFETLLNVAPMGVYLVDADFRFAALNPTALAAFGHVPDLIGRDFDTFIHLVWPPAFADEIVGLFRHTLASGEPCMVPERGEVRLDLGVVEVYEWRLSRIPLPDGRHGVVCYFQEISERIRAQQKIRESEERYRTLFRSIDEGFCVVELIFEPDGKAADFRFLEVNPSFEKQTGIRGAPDTRIREIVPQIEAHWLETLGGVARTGEAIRFTNEMRELNRWFDVYAFRLGGAQSRTVAVLLTDVTRRRENEERLSEKARLLDLSNDAIIVRDLDDRITLWNKGAEKLYGWSSGEALGQPSLALLRTEFPLPVEDIVAQLDREGQFSGEVVQRARDGRRLPSLCRWVLDRDSQSILTSYTDITERKAAEEALRKSEARFHAIIAQATVGIAEMDLAGRYTLVNERFCAIVGRSAAELQTLRPVDITHPDDLGAVAARFKVLAKGRVDFSIEKRYVRPDGTEVWVNNSVAWITGRDDVPQGFVEISQDISERKRLEGALQTSESYFRELTQSIPIGVWTSQPDGRVDFINRHWVAYTGVQLDSAVPHHDVFALSLHPDDRDRVQHVAATHRAVDREYTVEARFRDAGTGVYRWFLKRSVPVRDAGGRLQKRIGICIDIDDLKRAQNILADHAGELELQVQARTAELRETIGELEAFSYSVSHDMRAPLRAMQGFSLLLLLKHEANLDAKSVDQLRRISASAGRMDALINDVLTYSRLLRSEIVLQPVDLDLLVRQVIATYPNLHASGAEIAIAGPLPAVLGNEASLTQCVSNLLSNAVKFVAPGTGARVTVRAEPIGGDVRLWIEDNGIGIAAADHVRIWAIFTRVGGAKDHEGTGIGLAIVRKAMERMNGTLGLESDVGAGSRFWLQLKKADIL